METPQRRVVPVVFLAVLLATLSARAVDYTFTGKAPPPGDHTWSAPANWSPNGVPGNGDTATISGLVTTYVTLDQPVTISGLTLAGANLRVANNLAVSGAFKLQAATLAGAGTITANGSVSIDPLPGTPGVLTYLGCPLVVNGQAVINPNATLTYTAQVAIQNNGTFTLANNATLDFGNNVAGQFINTSMFAASNSIVAGGNAAALFTNAPGGTVSALSGVLQIGAGPAVASSGAFNAGSNCVIKLTANAAFHDGATFTGPGTTLLDSMANTADGTITTLGNLQLGDGFVSANLTELGTLNIAAGANFNWLGSTIQGNNSNIVGRILVSGSMTLGGEIPLYLLSTIINNNGTVNWTNDWILTMGYGASIVNGSRFYASGSTTMTPLTSGEAGHNVASFQNGRPSDTNYDGSLGTFIVNLATNLTVVIAVPFYNSGGDVFLQGGNLDFEGGGALDGSYVADGRGAGSIAFGEGTYVTRTKASFDASTNNLMLINPGADFRLTGGTLAFNSVGLLQMAGGVIEGVGLLDVASSSTFLWTGGSISVSNAGPANPAIRIEANAVWDIAGSGYKYVSSGTCYNQGVINLTTNAAGLANYVSVGDGEVFDNLGVFHFQSDEGLVDASSVIRPVFTNEASGLIVKSALNGSSAIKFPLKNLGSIVAQSGTLALSVFDDLGALAGGDQLVLQGGALQFDKSTTFHGTLQGNGTIIVNGVLTNQGNISGDLVHVEGDSANEGELQLGDAPGLFTIQNFSQSAAGTLIVPILGTNAAAQEFGQLLASGTMTLGGTLTVVITNGFVPPIGATFPFLSSSLGGSRIGTFDTLQLPSGMSIKYIGNGATLVVTGAVPVQILVPETLGGQFQFRLNTVNGQSYTVQYKDDLTANGWTFYTNFTGNGSTMQIEVATPFVAHRFYRVSEP